MSKHSYKNIIQEANLETSHQITRKYFFKECFSGIGAMALGSMVGGCDWLGDKDQFAQFGNSNPLMA